MRGMMSFICSESSKCMRRAKNGQIPLPDWHVCIFRIAVNQLKSGSASYPGRAMGSLCENPRWKQTNIDLFLLPANHPIQHPFEGGILGNRFFCHYSGIYSGIILFSYYKSIKARTCSWQYSSSESKYSSLLHAIFLPVSHSLSPQTFSHTQWIAAYDLGSYSQKIFAAGISWEKQ